MATSRSCSHGSQSCATLSRKNSAILLAFLCTPFALIFVIICCRICGCPSLDWRIRSRRRTTTANTSTSNTTAANVARVSSNTSTAPFTSLIITSNIVPAATSSSSSQSDHPEAIASTPSFVYKSAASEDKLECAVCLMKCKDGEKGRLLMGCGHSFHAECIDMWFQSHSTCPICRSTVETTRPERLV